ncbi:hypothetical protein [Alkalibacillus haloalkaliphilus]|uniref:Uncharacterized protein n=1 Tax=Alkalibacillus haloalkaliphilus TaxID=94136 RepID=A0A511W7X1_9BACI|nr:hypothetical protein [Alkalibacillus haloalkaliphilus]GEN47184.1 hypothetical protein AHA02nite_29600 [Alkalibacillus haloalkaliphilus]
MSKADEIKNKLNKNSNATKQYLEAFENHEEKEAENHELSSGDKNKEEQIKRLKQSARKKKMEDTHVRQTFLIEKELAKELDKITQKNARGFKTEFINYAILQALKDINDD